MSASTTAGKPWRNAHGQTLEELKGTTPDATVDRSDGLTGPEGKVMDALTDAVAAFKALPVQHPSEQRDFADAIHRCQDLLAVRIARRAYPKGWPDRSVV